MGVEDEGEVVGGGGTRGIEVEVVEYGVGDQEPSVVLSVTSAGGEGDGDDHFIEAALPAVSMRGVMGEASLDGD